MKSYVLDSFAVISYLNGEKGALKVAEVFSECLQNQNPSKLCLVNYGEVLYHALRAGGKEKEREAKSLMDLLPLDIVNIDLEITRTAARYKANNKMSFADAFAASTAKFYNSTLVTGDNEFKPLEKELKIEWLK